ncbi:MAG: hypothetical protein CMO44_10870 [Verrucomicrobiales bacterium]|nr:hypothetical protein [Verrucomicrobiales bacterium]
MKFRLERLDGDFLGEQVEVSGFPFKIGRDINCHHRIEAKGVWPCHLVLEEAGENGIIVKCDPEASLSINSLEASKSVRLQNGDLLQFGSVRLRFWLAPIGQMGQRSIELIIWLGLSMLILGQVTIMAWLLKFI